MSYEPLHHKYRPQTFGDLVGQEAIATTLTNAIRTAKIAPAYLFTGPRGTGKTSSARILAKSLNCLKSEVPTENPCGICVVCHSIAKGSALDVIEIDAASNTGVDNIRELIERAQFAPVQCRYKVYAIDECHMLSVSAFNALLKTLEEPPERVVFILATTDPQRVLPTIISRCQRFDFRRIPLEAMVNHLQKIAAIENININQEALQLVAQIAQGGLRDAESLLDQLSLFSGQVTVERVWDLVGACSELDLMQLLQAIAQNNPEAVLDCARKVMDRGREPLTILQNLASFYRDLLIAKTAPNRSDLVAVTSATWNALCEQAHFYDIASILAGQQHLAKSEVQLKNTTQPRLWLEVTLLGLLSAANSSPEQIKPVSIQPSQRPETSHERHTPTQQPPHPIPVNHAVADHSVPPAIDSYQPPAPQEPLELNSDTSIPDPPAITPLPSAAEVNSSQSGEQILPQVLANLQPISTRELLRQMCRLTHFDGAVAHIEVKSQVWYKKVQIHLPKITAAFGATFKREIQVSLELATSTQTQNAFINKEAPARGKAPALDSPPPIPSTAQTQAITFQPVTTISTAIADVPTDPNAADWQDDEVAIAAQRLADFFNGQVVKNLDATLTQPVTTSPPLMPTTAERVDFAPEDDDDVEF